MNVCWKYSAPKHEGIIHNEIINIENDIPAAGMKNI
jgi:hypothetical protein